jgi:hypothetical protein
VQPLGGGFHTTKYGFNIIHMFNEGDIGKVKEFLDLCARLHGIDSVQAWPL